LKKTFCLYKIAMQGVSLLTFPCIYVL
jgi:hypothetical protein